MITLLNFKMHKLSSLWHSGASPRRRSPHSYASRRSRSPVRGRGGYSPLRERSFSRSPPPFRSSYRDSPHANGYGIFHAYEFQ
jgi:hypothetical protein